MPDNGPSCHEGPAVKANIKVTDQQVEEIRQRAAAGEARRDLAIFFGVSLETISRYIRGDSRITPIKEPEELGLPSAKALEESANRLLAEQEKVREVKGARTKPVVETAGTGALSPERVQWLLGN